MTSPASCAFARALAVMLCACPAIAAGSLVQYGLSAADDGLVTLDTDTGLEWLHLPLTAGHSFNEVAAGYGGYMTLYGFQLASRSAVAALFTNAGGVDGYGSASRVPAATELTLHLGYAQELLKMGGTMSHYFTQGLMAPEGDAAGPPVAVLYLLFERETAILGVTQWTNQGYGGLDNAGAGHALWLVRTAASPFGPSPTQPPDVFPPPQGPFVEPPPPPIPEPASVALWSAGLAMVMSQRWLRLRTGR